MKLFLFQHVLRFENVRIPRENLLNSVADISADEKYLNSIKDLNINIILNIKNKLFFVEHHKPIEHNMMFVFPGI